MRHILNVILLLAIILSNPYISLCRIISDKDTTAATDSSYGKIDYTKLAIVTCVTGTMLTYSFLDQYEEYWQDNGSFHIMTLKNEYDDALMSDKFGHLYLTYAAAKTYRYAFEWMGMDSLSAIWWAAGVAVTHQTLTEIQDGFSHGRPYLGFSLGDITANFLGAGLAVLQVEKPFWRNFYLKLSLRPPKRYYGDFNSAILHDYESRYNWLSVDVHNLIPQDWRKWYPSFVNLALGFSVKGINRFGSGHHEWFLALDWNIKDDNDDSLVERIFKHLFNSYHFPAPAIKLYPDVIWYGLMF